MHAGSTPAESGSPVTSQSTTPLASAIAASPDVAGRTGTAPRTSAGCPSVRAIQKVPWGEGGRRRSRPLHSLFPEWHGLKILQLWLPPYQARSPRSAAASSTSMVLGWDSFAQYAKNPSLSGATIGRVGNRISNAHFVLDGKTYKLAANNGRHALPRRNQGLAQAGVASGDQRDSSGSIPRAVARLQRRRRRLPGDRTRQYCLYARKRVTLCAST